MAFAAVQHLATGSSDGGNSVTTAGVDTTGADLIVLAVSKFGTTAVTVSDSKGNTWTPLTEQASTNARTKLYYCVSPTVGSGHTFTASGSGTFPTISALAVSGVKTADAFDQESAGGSGSGSSIQPGSLTPDEDNCLVVAAASSFNPSLSSVDGGFTLQLVTNVGSQHISGGSAYLIQTAAAAANPTFTLDGSAVCSAVSASFHAAAAGGGPSTNSEFAARIDIPHPFVGPMALRQGWRPQPIQDFTQAPVTTTLPGVQAAVLPNPHVGPMALRQGWRQPPPYNPATAPATDTEYGSRVRVPHPFAGPQVLRQRWRPQPIQDFTQAAPASYELGTRVRVPHPFVGPPVLRRMAAQRATRGDTSVAVTGNRRRRVICSAA